MADLSRNVTAEAPRVWDQPPNYVAPTNTTALTAMVISSLPFSITLDVSGEPTSREFWFTYTATADDVVVGVVPYADVTSTYLPRLTIYEGPASAPVVYHVQNSPQRSAYVPVTAGTVYLWKVVQTPGGVEPLGTTLTFKAQSGPQNPVILPALLATEENIGFPAPVLSGSVDGEIFYYLAGFPTAVMGVALSDGTIISDDSTEEVVIYDVTLTEIFRGQPYYAFTPQWMSSNTIDTFYLPYQPVDVLELHTLTATGATTGDSWTLPANSENARAGAPSRDDTIFYYGGDSVLGVPQGVHRYDLVNDVALSDLVGTLANHSVQEIIVADDGSILVAYRNGNTDCVVKRYDTSGTTLTTYTFTSILIHHIALAYDDPLTFWVWTQTPMGSPSQCTFARLLISNGSTVESADYNLFAAGPSRLSYDPTYTTVDDVPLFGPAPTCTFFPLIPPPWNTNEFVYITDSVLAQLYGDSTNSESVGVRDTSPIVYMTNVPIGPAPNGEVDPIRRLRQAPHLWTGANTRRINYPGFELLVESGALRETDRPLTFFLQWSTDGGHQWSNLHEVQGSNLGQYRYRFIWRRLGQSRDRVFRVINSDDAKIVLVDAILNPDPTEGSS